MQRPQNRLLQRSDTDHVKVKQLAVAWAAVVGAFHRRAVTQVLCSDTIYLIEKAQTGEYIFGIEIVLIYTEQEEVTKKKKSRVSDKVSYCALLI